MSMGGRILENLKAFLAMHCSASRTWVMQKFFVSLQVLNNPLQIYWKPM